MKSRTKARSIALQVLYELDMTTHLPGSIFEERLVDEPLDSSLVEFSRQIIFGVMPISIELDNYIAQHAPEWPMDQVAIIDRNIIRIAMWEFAVQQCTPVKVAINEAIELAKFYGSDSTPRFVNGVLGALANRTNEIHQAFTSIIKSKPG
jgi:N utilization substance protein B